MTLANVSGLPTADAAGVQRDMLQQMYGVMLRVREQIMILAGFSVQQHHNTSGPFCIDSSQCGLSCPRQCQTRHKLPTILFSASLYLTWTCCCTKASGGAHPAATSASSSPDAAASALYAAAPATPRSNPRDRWLAKDFSRSARASAWFSCNEVSSASGDAGALGGYSFSLLGACQQIVLASGCGLRSRTTLAPAADPEFAKCMS